MSMFNVNSASFDEVYVSGSISISGSLLINNNTIENYLSLTTIDATDFGKLKFEAEQNLDSDSLVIPNYIDVEEAPKKYYFRFNKNKLQNNWTSSAAIEKITLSLDNIDPMHNSAYRGFIWDILVGNWIGSEITLTSVSIPQNYKTFTILGGVAYQKAFRNTDNLYYELQMSENWKIISSGSVSGSDFRFKNEHQYSLPDGESITYVKFFVEEIDSGMYESRPPMHDDEFTIYMTKDKRKRKEIFEFTSSVTPWTPPSWADKLTIYAIGAGGGGGAGSVGWGHPLDIPYQPSAQQEISVGVEYSGFEFVTGGGGGAGGNIAISEFILLDQNNTSLNSNTLGSTALPKYSNFYIYVGKGGSGGESLTFDDLSYIDNDIKKNHVNTILLGQASQALLSDVVNTLYPINQSTRNYRKFQLPKYAAMGKNGSDSSVYLAKDSNLISNKDIELVKATGGQGGMHGFSVQFYYQSWHRLCNVYDTHYLIDYITPGGGSNLKNSFGNVEVIPGGHGGNGIFTPTARQFLINPKDDPNGLITSDFWRTTDFKQGSGVVRTYPTSSVQSSYKAPNIPWDKNYEMPYLKLPFGNTSDVTVSDVVEKGYTKYIKNSTIKPTKIAPLGGNGGVGASWQVVDVRNYNDYYFTDSINNMKNRAFYISGEITVRGDIPDDVFQKTSEELAKNIVYNNKSARIEGNNNLISTKLPNGKNYVFALSSRGALGGFSADNYIDTDGQYVNLPKVIESAQPTNNHNVYPENGPQIGCGGGGGASSYCSDYTLRNAQNQNFESQAGADGARGIVIIIAEEL